MLSMTIYFRGIAHNTNALPLDEVTGTNVGINRKSSELVETIYLAYCKQYLTSDNELENKRKTEQSTIVSSDRSTSSKTMELFGENKVEKLYLWFLFMNRPKMAEFLCSICQNQTTACLLAVDIYSKAAQKDKKNRDTLIQIAYEFDEHAKGIIDECFVKKSSLAIDIINGKATEFYDYAPLVLAKHADSKAFLASDTVQKYLNDKWYHHFDDQRQLLNVNTSFWIMLASFIFPLLPIASLFFPSLYKEYSLKPKKKINKSIQCRPILSHERISTDEKARNESFPSGRNRNSSKNCRIELGDLMSSMGLRIKYFYEAPVVRFYYYVIFYFIFLTLFSYVLLVDYFPLNRNGAKRSGIQNLPIPISEFILHIYMLNFIIDEIYQVYISDKWIHVNPFLQRQSKNTHMKDTFLIFVCFILVFLLAFSITSWSLLSTKNQITWLYSINGSLINFTIADENKVLSNWQLIRDVFNWGIWKVFGQVAEPYNDNNTDMEVVSENDIYGTFVFLYAIIFVVISNVLLLNVLIAMFNETIGDVIKKSNMIWRYQRFFLVHEFSEKPILPSPLSIIYYLVRFIIYALCRSKCIRYFSIKSNESGENNIENNFYQMNVEKEYAEIYWKSKIFIKNIQLSTEKTLQRLENKVNGDNDHQLQHFQDVKNEIRETQYLVSRRLNLQWISQRLTISQTIIPNIPANANWVQNGVTVAGGHGQGSATDQLSSPWDLFVDDDQTVVITDQGNHRIIQWKMGDTNGQVVAGGKGAGSRLDQLNHPTDVLIDKETDSLIICDHGNQRVVRWSRRSGTTQGDILLEYISCVGLAMDDQRYLYVSDDDKYEVTRYQLGDKTGTLVAGGNGTGAGLNQLNKPTNLFVDRQQTVYVSDFNNHRVMKWTKGAKEGIVVAGGQGKWNALTRLYWPNGLFIDTLGTLYVAEQGTHRVIRWPQGAKEGTVIVGGTDAGVGANQLSCPHGLSSDRHGNLYVADYSNYRVQRFSIE
ncbi:unnamed protein product [Rotaria socialis]